MTIESAASSINNQQLASSPEASAWVSASAGTGKTKVLTDRILRLMLEGVAPQRILCLTFTRAAAAEMATRGKNQLVNWQTVDDIELIQDTITRKIQCVAFMVKNSKKMLFHIFFVF